MNDAQLPAVAAAASRRGRRTTVASFSAIALLVAIALLAPARAQALLGDTQSAFGLDGSLRSVMLGALNYDEPALFGGRDTDAYAQVLARFVAAGRPLPELSYEVHIVQSLDTSTADGASGSAGAGLPLGGASSLRYRAFDGAWDQQDHGDWRRALILDRAALGIALGPVDLTVGRQAVSFGKTFFWSPLDVFAPFDPRQLDRDYKPGVDALRADFSLGAFSGANLLAVAGRRLSVHAVSGQDRRRDVSRYGSAVFARLFTTVSGWDLALQGGKVYGGYHAGLGVVGEAAGIDLRAEAVLFRAEEDAAPRTDAPASPQDILDSLDNPPDAESVVIGIGHRFESSLDLHAEYFFNGGGNDDLNTSFQRFVHGDLLNAGRHLIGVSAAYELLPILQGTLAWIVSADDGSGQIVPSLVWSAADEVDVVFGLFIAHGARPRVSAAGTLDLQSEFGTFPSYLYIEPKIYF